MTRKSWTPSPSFDPVSVNHSGTDFLMLVDAGGIQLVRKSSIAPWKHVVGEIRNSRPQFLGDDLMHIETAFGATPTPLKAVRNLATYPTNDPGVPGQPVHLPDDLPRSGQPRAASLGSGRMESIGL